MNNEPVAWMQDYQNCKCPDNEARCFSDLVFRMMQKHTQPVKELTMAEIEDFINAYGLDMGDVYEFSLAQLTKMIVEIEHQIRGGK